MIMKPIMSALIAVSALTGMGASAHAAWNASAFRTHQEESVAGMRQAQPVVWTDEDQRGFWDQQGDRGG
jgi:hypothetical protein